jgi:hypothetical protein
MVDKSGLRYYPMPIAREAAGGQALFRKAMTWINLWRPPSGMLDDNGMPLEDNVTIIDIEKAKPKGVGKKGQTKLYLDWKRNRFYEFPKLYAFDHEK